MIEKHYEWVLRKDLPGCSLGSIGFQLESDPEDTTFKFKGIYTNYYFSESQMNKCPDFFEKREKKLECGAVFCGKYYSTNEYGSCEEYEEYSHENNFRNFRYKTGDYYKTREQWNEAQEAIIKLRMELHSKWGE